MQRQILRMILGLMLLTPLVVPSMARAARHVEEKEIYDARYEGYPVEVNVKSPGASGAYFIWALLGVLSVSVLFKDARRTHLD